MARCAANPGCILAPMITIITPFGWLGSRNVLVYKVLFVLRCIISKDQAQVRDLRQRGSFFIACCVTHLYILSSLQKLIQVIKNRFCLHHKTYMCLCGNYRQLRFWHWFQVRNTSAQQFISFHQLYFIKSIIVTRDE